MSLYPRLVAIQGIGFTPIYAAVQGLLDYIESGGTTHRPRASPAVKLTKIIEGRAWLTCSRTATRSRPLAASGFVPAVVLTSAGYVALQSVKVNTRASRLPTSSGARVVVRGYQVTTRGFALSTSAGCHVGVVSGAAVTWSGVVAATGGATATTGTCTVSSACERVKSRGTRGISDYEAAVIARFVDARRQCSTLTPVTRS